jgi:hypothetical protein
MEAPVIFGTEDLIPGQHTGQDKAETRGQSEPGPVPAEGQHQNIGNSEQKDRRQHRAFAPFIKIDSTIILSYPRQKHGKRVFFGGKGRAKNIF